MWQLVILVKETLHARTSRTRFSIIHSFTTHSPFILSSGTDCVLVLLIFPGYFYKLADRIT